MKKIKRICLLILSLCCMMVFTNTVAFASSGDHKFNFEIRDATNGNTKFYLGKGKVNVEVRGQTVDNEDYRMGVIRPVSPKFKYHIELFKSGGILAVDTSDSFIGDGDENSFELKVPKNGNYYIKVIVDGEHSGNRLLIGSGTVSQPMYNNK